MTVADHTSFLDLPALIAARGKVRLPGSKSISNRVLLLAALAEGETELRDVLVSDDTARMLEALEVLGAGVDRSRPGIVRVSGLAGVPKVKTADLFLGNAGTAFRSLAAVLARYPILVTIPDRAYRRSSWSSTINTVPIHASARKKMVKVVPRPSLLSRTISASFSFKVR